MSSPIRRSRLRFSIESLHDGRAVVVDWARGTIYAGGVGRRWEQDAALGFVWAYLRLHGDINLTRLPATLGQAPEWPGGIAPPEREGWLAEQRRIHRAFGEVAGLIRRRKLEGDELAQDPQFRRLLGFAHELVAEALRAVGLEPLPIMGIVGTPDGLGPTGVGAVTVPKRRRRA